MKYKRIFLIGFRTTGKTTFGKILAENLGLSFFDMDFLIKEQSRQEVDSLTQKGSNWVKFREIENEILRELTKVDRAVISCGGGVGVNDILDIKTKKTFGQLNQEILKKSKDSLIILLTSTDDKIKERLFRQFKNKKVMPFLNPEYAQVSASKNSLIKKQVDDSMKALQKRKPLYSKLADFEIETSNFIFPKKLVNLNVIIGDPINHSLSPRMHNFGYVVLGIDKANLFIPVRVKNKNLKKFIKAVKTLGINGISVTSPHKETIINYLDNLDEDAKKIVAVNTVLNKAGKLTGYNTDWVGAITALEKRTDLKSKGVAIIGAGGVARAIIFGLIKKGAKVKIFNRSLEKAKILAKEFGVEWGEDMEEIKGYDIIINATSVGMNEDKSLISEDLLNKNQIVFDIIYSPKETKLIKEARGKGAQVIYGYEMLLYQGVEQFKLYTGLEAPVKEMEKTLVEGLK